MHQSWLWMFLGCCFLAAVLGGPAQLTTGPGHGTSPAAKLQHTLVAADVARIPHSQAPDLSPQQIVFEQPQDAIVGQPVPVTAYSVTTASSPVATELPVSLRSDTPQVCTVSGTAVTPTAPGTCVITASQGGSTQYAPATDVARAFQAHAGSGHQAIIFIGELPQTAKVGQQVQLSAYSATTASYAASSLGPTGLPVSFRSDTPEMCTVSDAIASLTEAGTVSFTTVTVTPSAAGTCVITASQGGNAKYAPATDVAIGIQVLAGPTPQTITFNQLSDTAQVGQPIPLTASSPAAMTGPPVSFRSDTPQVCTVSETTVTPAAAGTCVITASHGGNAQYAPATDVAQGIQVLAGPTPQTITFNQMPGAATVGQPIILSASATSGMAVSFRSNTRTMCIVSANTLIPIAQGGCSITATQGGNGDYASAEATLWIKIQTGSGQQTINFYSPKPLTVGMPVVLTAWSTDSKSSEKTGLPVSFYSRSPDFCTVSGATVIPIAPGCTVTAIQGGNGNYARAEINIPVHVSTGQLPQTINFDRPPRTTVGKPIVLTASSADAKSSVPTGLRVSYYSESRDVCTVSHSTLILTNTGMCKIVAFQGGSVTYAAIFDDGEPEFPVERADQTIDFPQPPGMTYGQTQTLTATTDSGLPVTFTSESTNACTVSGTNGSTVTAVKTGTCTITATQPGDTNHNPAPSIPRQFGIGRASQTIDFSPPTSAAVGQPLTLTASSVTTTSPPAPTGLSVIFTSNTTDICTVSSATVNAIQAGQECSITASQPGDGNYLAAPSITLQFPTERGSQTISFPAITGATVGKPVKLGAKASSGLPVTYASATPDVCTVAGTFATASRASTCTITASQPGDQNYLEAEPRSRSFLAKKMSQTISFTPPNGATVGQRLTLGAKASSGLRVSYASANPDACPVSGSTVTPAEGGTCTITASQAGNDNYTPAQSVKKSFAVARLRQAIDFPQPPDVAFGKPVTLSAKASSGLPVSFGTGTPDVCTVSGATVTTRTVGTCRVTASQAGDARYAPVRGVARSFQVERATQTITFNPPDGAAVGQPVTLSASASSGLPVTYRTDNSSECTVSGPTVTLAKPGTCTITASQAGNDKYEAAPDLPRSFPVHLGHGPRTRQAINFAQPSGVAIGRVVPLSATATSGLQVSFSSGTPSVCTVSGATVTTARVGTCAVIASQGGDDRFAPARDVQRSFTVHAKTHGNNGPGQKASQAIFFGPPPAAAVGQVVPLSASTTSGLQVLFRPDTPSVCAVSGTTVTTTAAGTCAVTASQAGDSRYLAAHDIAQSFPVHAGHQPQTITFPPPPEATVGEPVTLSGSATSGLEVAYRTDTPRTCTVSGSTVSPAAAGTCTLTASQGGSDRYAAARDVKQSFQVAAASSILPNALKFLLGAAVLAAAGVTALVRRVRRPRRPPPPQPSLRVAPDPGPPTLVSVQNTEAGVPHTVRLEPSPGASIITIKEAKP
jgi:hypothetical protein